MANPFDGLNDAFGAEPSELQKHVEKVKPTLKKSETEDVRQDYEVSRAQLHNLVMKGQRQLMEYLMWHERQIILVLMKLQVNLLKT